jgi:hypothetical protein
VVGLLALVPVVGLAALVPVAGLLALVPVLFVRVPVDPPVAGGGDATG